MPTITVQGKGEREVSAPLASVLKEWDVRAREYFGVSIPVGVVHYKNTPLKDGSPINTAAVTPSDGPWKLLVILATLDSITDELIAHEILHKTLAVEGFRECQLTDTPNSQLQQVMNSMIAHVPLNTRMRRHGFDPWVLEDPKANVAIDRIGRFSGYPEGEPSVCAACLFADSILQASPALSERVRDAKDKFPEIGRMTEAILSTIGRFDMNSPEQYRAACVQVCEALEIRRFSRFAEYDHMAYLKEQMG